MFLWWSSTKIVRAIWIRQKHSRQGERGLFSLYIYIENLKNLLVRNHWKDCNIMWQKCSFGDRFPYNFAEMFLWWSSTKIVQAIWIRQKTWPPGGWGLFSLNIYIEKLEKSSCQKPLDWFHYNLAKMFSWWSSTKIVQVIVICQKTWSLGGGAYFPYISI